MEFSIKKLAPETAKAGCIVVGVHQAGELTQAARAVDQASKGAVRAALRDLSGKTGSTLLLRGLPGIAAERVLLVGLGDHEEFAEAAFRDAVRAAAAALKELGAKDAALFLADLKVGSRPSAWNVRQAGLATREAFYRFDEHKPPKFIVLRYSGAGKSRRPVVLVGKGITFDTGGISLKPSSEMDEMKFDMSGAASVLGTVRALAAMKAPVNVIGVAPACENMPGGHASRPGDVVTTLSGQTVEILNTDAEGRLILCDALTYAERFKPEAVVDIATLTGACVVALGHVASGLFSNDQKLADEIREAADDAWDRVWQMPLWEDYQEQLRSNFADMANIGGRPAGSVTAACFLARFTRKQRWAHIDIAGTAWKSGREKGSTGRPVPLLVRFLLRHAGRK